ncbi:hypothetical protein [Embleya sp. NPDC001921]
MRKTVRRLAVAVIAPAVLLVSGCGSDSGDSDSPGFVPGGAGDTAANGGPVAAPSKPAAKERQVLSGTQLAAALVTTQELPGRTATPDRVSQGSEMSESNTGQDGAGPCQPLYDLLGGTDWYVAEDRNLPALFTSTKVRESGRADDQQSGYEIGLSQHRSSRAQALIQGARNALPECGGNENSRGFKAGTDPGFGDDSLTIVVPTEAGSATFSYVRSGSVLIHVAPVSSAATLRTLKAPAAPETLLRTQYEKLLRAQTT